MHLAGERGQDGILLTSVQRDCILLTSVGQDGILPDGGNRKIFSRLGTRRPPLGDHCASKRERTVLSEKASPSVRHACLAC
jgi:hypothetical protein